MTTYKEITYTDSDINEMREWLSDLTFADDVDIQNLTDLELIRGVSRHYDGGLVSFIKAIAQ